MTRLGTRSVPGKWLLSAQLVFLALPATAATDLPDKVDSFMEYLMDHLDVVPGYAIAIAGPDSTILARGYGTTAAPGGQPMDADTQVYIASATKSLTGLAVASLAEKGLVDLGVGVDRYVPELDGSAAGRTTLRQLLSHTHGLEEDGLTWRTAYSGQYTDEILLDLVKRLPLADDQRAFRYSNTGYVVASIVLEQYLDKSWKQIVAEEVLAPAGMSSTTAF